MHLTSRSCFHGLVLACLVAIPAPLRALAAGYDPLAINSQFVPEQVELTVHDARRARDIPIRVYLPAGHAAEPVVLFSHGLGGSRAGSSFLGRHWAARGYVAVFVQHPGSDDSVWRGKDLADVLPALRQAASLENFVLRVEDVHAVLDQLNSWNGSRTHALAGRLDLARVGMSGHSFGAVTTEAVSGESLSLNGQKFTDQRIKAAVVFSPSAPETGDPAKAFGTVTIPWLLMTGTKDIAPIGHADMKSRLAVYPALHRGPKYEVVLNNAEHSVFTDRALPGDREPRNPNHHRVILALSTAFWDAYLRGDPAARTWLDGAGPRSLLEAEDQWQLSVPGQTPAH